MSPWPQRRCFPFTTNTDLPHLSAAWDLSQTKIERLRQVLDTPPLSSKAACVAISGSVSRMEAHAASDLDLLIVVDDRHRPVSERSAEHLFQDVWQRIDVEMPELARPKPDGVFSRCVSWQAMTDPSVRGIVNENVTTFGQRMQLLLDAQPVLHRQAFVELQQDVLNWYVETQVSGLFQEAGPFGWLRQDVQRYWRSIWSRAYWLHQRNAGQLIEVNVKLRSSRVAIIAGFLQAIDHAHNTAGKVPYVISALQRQLTTTPLERLAAGLSTTKQTELLHSYQTVWCFLAGRNPGDGGLPQEVSDALKHLAGCLPTSVTE